MTLRAILLALSAALFAAMPARAEDYPTRPINAIIPFAGGSASDVVARILFDRMSRSLGQPIIVENRPGAGGNTGTAAAAKATPDGYTLLGGSTGPMAANTCRRSESVRATKGERIPAPKSKPSSAT